MVIFFSLPILSHMHIKNNHFSLIIDLFNSLVKDEVYFILNTTIFITLLNYHLLMSCICPFLHILLISILCANIMHFDNVFIFISYLCSTELNLSLELNMISISLIQKILIGYWIREKVDLLGFIICFSQNLII